LVSDAFETVILLRNSINGKKILCIKQFEQKNCGRNKNFITKASETKLSLWNNS